MKLSELLKIKIKEALDYSPRKNWGLQKDTSILYTGGRAYSKLIIIDENEYVKKIFCRNSNALKSFKKELLAQKVFSSMPWINSIKQKGKTLLGQPWFLCKKFPLGSRLDYCAPNMSQHQKKHIALIILSAVLDMHSFRIAHRDLHAKHIFYYHDGIKIIDFDAMTLYPTGYNPLFSECYDLTGQGLESPFFTGNMGFFKDHPYSLSNTLKVSHDAEVLLETLKTNVTNELNRALVATTFFEPICTHIINFFSGTSLSFPKIEIMKEDKNDLINNVKKGLSGNIKNKNILLVGIDYASIFIKLINYYPNKIILFEPNENTFHAIRRYIYINDLKRASVYNGGIKKIVQNKFEKGYFDLVIFQHRVKNTMNDYRILSSLTKQYLIVHIDKQVDKLRIAKLIRKSLLEEKCESNYEN